MDKTKYFCYRTEKELEVFEKKLLRLKAERIKNPKLNKTPLKIIDTCKVFIELYQNYNKCPVVIPSLVEKKGSCLYDNESDAYAFKSDVKAMNMESKEVKDFFLRKNLKKFDKDPNKICEFCREYKSYKDTGICEGLIFPVKNWNTKMNS